MTSAKYQVAFDDIRVAEKKPEDKAVHNLISIGMHPISAGVDFPIFCLLSQLRYLGSTLGLYVIPPLASASSFTLFPDSSLVVSCLVMTGEQQTHVPGSVLLGQAVTRSKSQNLYLSVDLFITSVVRILCSTLFVYVAQAGHFIE